MNSTPTTPSALVLDQITTQNPAPDNPRRNGKIARLPRETRLLINRMLDDGLPYHVIIDELGDAGAGLNVQNLSNWVHGGYQEYLEHQELIDRARAQFEFATDLLRELDHPDPTLLPRALNLVAATQMMTAIMYHGEAALQTMLQTKPLAYLTMLNTLCNMTDCAIKLDLHRHGSELAPKAPLPPADTAGKSPIFKPIQGDSSARK